jgi:hypothetical protein
MTIHKAGETGNRNKELYRETAHSNWIKPSIATMPDYSRITVFILTPLIFRYHLPLKVVGNEKLGGSRGWLLVEGDTELWRSMSVCFLM